MNRKVLTHHTLRKIYDTVNATKKRDKATLVASSILAALGPRTGTLNGRYHLAWLAAQEFGNYRFRRDTDKWIHAHSAAGRAKIARAANIMRARDGAIHHAIVQALIGQTHAVEKLPIRAGGDILVNGKVNIECKRTLRERRRQIFADHAIIDAVVVGTLDKASSAEYCKNHGAKLVICDPENYADNAHLPGVISLDKLVASL